MFCRATLPCTKAVFQRGVARSLWSLRPVAMSKNGILTTAPKFDFGLPVSFATTRRLQMTQTRWKSTNTFSDSVATNKEAGTAATNAPEPANSPQSNSAPKKKANVAEIRKLLALAKPELRLILLALVFLVITSSVTMTVPLLVGKIIDTARPLESLTIEERQKQLENDTLYFGFPEKTFYTGVAVLFAVGACSNFCRFYLLKLAGEKLVARMRSRLFSKILSQDSYFFDVGPTKTGMKSGDLISRLSSDTSIIAKSISGNISDGARASISGVVGLTMMWLVSWKLTMAMSMLFPPLVIMAWGYGRRIKELSRKVQENLGSLTKVTEEYLGGLKTIQTFARQKSVVHEYNKEIRQLFQVSMTEGKLSGIFFGGNGFLGNVTIVGLLFYGTRLIGSGELSIGDLSSFMMYAAYTGGSVFGLGNFYTELMKAIGAAERIFQLTESRPQITTTVGKKVADLHGDIVFRDIEFSYPSRPHQPVFGASRLNLTIKRGDNVCIVGPSGSGKSTISQLLLRFYDPGAGTVTVNNHDIKHLNLNFFRSQIGYVQQEPLLFSGTLRENITFGKDNCTDAEIDRALTLSNCHGFINSFPKGLDTVVGPANSGAQLSGGQKQRISLARTLIKQPQILVLDEATSALDSISEETVMKNLKPLASQKGVTMISIAHRLSTIKNSDRVVVLNETGQIVEDGPFAELYGNKQSEFNKLLKKHDTTESDN